MGGRQLIGINFVYCACLLIGRSHVLLMMPLLMMPLLMMPLLMMRLLMMRLLMMRLLMMRRGWANESPPHPFRTSSTAHPALCE
ncbi:MAG: hypothetical protein R6U20_05605 [Longimonas sp.]|uniref:hypothetical protein n=1 Tax=Longimonas sp. TaxID=2039626 RepID=UPI003974BEE0